MGWDDSEHDGEVCEDCVTVKQVTEERDDLARQLEEAKEEISECHLGLGYHCATDGCRWCEEDDNG